MAQPDYQKGDNIMYTIYNHTTGQYGMIYHSLTAARAWHMPIAYGHGTTGMSLIWRQVKS